VPVHFADAGLPSAHNFNGNHMPNLPFKQVDVFTAERFKGNPVAVVLQAEGLTADQMQRIANWTNLSETTFVVPATDPRADYRVRIFTPSAELPFAGHPTIGTAHALIEAGMVQVRDGRLVQQCAAGLIPMSWKPRRMARPGCCSTCRNRASRRSMPARPGNWAIFSACRRAVPRRRA
jgi:predicted PhzF superfamily epimerase YddE/YHI9